MKVLAVDDDRVTLLTLERLLSKFGYEPLVAVNGTDALKVFLEHRPKMLITDWMMPEMEGPTVVKTIRAFAESEYTYIVMLTSRQDKDDMMAGMLAGVDEFLTKPIDPDQLRARLRVGKRIMQLQDSLANRVKELEAERQHVKMLQGFLPICSYCKKIRDDENLWSQIEEYISDHQDVQFSHSICPDCYETKVKPMEEAFRAKKLAEQQAAQEA
ncbi:MAG: response regulator [Calditrichaeota bacterium]|nr:response regulator [Calditrichota bacterium]MCB9368862.1 response regulator [Calditrichota bacterium]